MNASFQNNEGRISVILSVEWTTTHSNWRYRANAHSLGSFGRTFGSSVTLLGPHLQSPIELFIYGWPIANPARWAVLSIALAIRIANRIIVLEREEGRQYWCSSWKCFQIEKMQISNNIHWKWMVGTNLASFGEKSRATLVDRSNNTSFLGVVTSRNKIVGSFDDSLCWGQRIISLECSCYLFLPPPKASVYRAWGPRAKALQGLCVLFIKEEARRPQRGLLASEVLLQLRRAEEALRICKERLKQKERADGQREARLGRNSAFGVFP